MTTVDSPWTEQQAELAEGLTEYEATLPACGHHPDALADEFDLVPDHNTCWVCRDWALQRRSWAQEDEHLPKPEAGRPHPLDGVHRYLRPATPGEVIEHRRNTKP